MKYIDINKNIIETQPESIATSRIEFIHGGYIDLTEDIENRLNEEEFDLLEYAFPHSPYITYVNQTEIIKILNGLEPRNHRIGSTLEDFNAGMHIPLNDEQEAWYQEHPDAEPVEVFKMGYDLEAQRGKKLEALSKYDNSEDVNSFIVNGSAAWLTVQERANYNTSIVAAELLGHNEVTFLIGGQKLTVSTEQAKQMLAAVQLYADACYIVTQTHKATLQNLKDLDAVMNYDFTQGYPDRLNFNI